MKYFSSPNKEVTRQQFIDAVINGWAAVHNNGPAVIVQKHKEYEITWIGGRMFAGTNPSDAVSAAELAAEHLSLNKTPLFL